MGDGWEQIERGWDHCMLELSMLHVVDMFQADMEHICWVHVKNVNWERVKPMQYPNTFVAFITKHPVVHFPLP